MARSITTRRPLWVEEVAVRRRQRRLRDRRHAGRLRAPREPRPGRGLPGRPRRRRASTTARTSATTSPTRAPSPRRSRASCSGFPAIAVSQQSRARRARLPLRRRLRLRARRALRRAARRALEDVAAAAARRCSTSTCPRATPERRRGDEPRQAHLPRRAEARARGGAAARRRYWIYGDRTPASTTSPAPTSPRSPPGGSRVTPMHFDLTDRPGLAALRELRPRRAARAA